MVLRDARASKKIVSFQLQMYKRTFQLKFVKINRSGVSEVVERKPFGSLAVFCQTRFCHIFAEHSSLSATKGHTSQQYFSLLPDFYDTSSSSIVYFCHTCGHFVLSKLVGWHKSFLTRLTQVITTQRHRRAPTQLSL